LEANIFKNLKKRDFIWSRGRFCACININAKVDRSIYDKSGQKKVMQKSWQKHRSLTFLFNVKLAKCIQIIKKNESKDALTKKSIYLS